MQITITCKEGATAKEIAHTLRWQANLIEGIMDPKEASAKTDAATYDDGGDEDFAETEKKTTKKTKTATTKKAAASFDDDEETETEIETTEDQTEDDDFTTTKKTAKAPKVTLDQVNDACKAKAASIGGKAGRETVLGILKKNFKTQSVSDLTPDQYAACIKLMKA